MLRVFLSGASYLWVLSQFQCKYFSNILLSQFLLILWSKEPFVFVWMGCGLVWFLFCFVHDLSRGGERETNIFYNINRAPALCTGDVYVVFVATGVW